MLLEMTRLAMGLAIALFHRQLADFFTEQDRALVVLFRRRGVSIPDAMRRDTAHTLYFCMGILVAMVEIVRIWMLLK